MPSATPLETRLINPVLTNIAQGYKSDQFIGTRILGIAEVPTLGGQIIDFGSEDFAVYNSIRSPGSNTKQIETTYAGRAFSLRLDALEHPVPNEYMNDAKYLGVNWDKFSMNRVMTGLGRNLEKEIADLLRTVANYNASNSITLSGTAQFSNSASDPAGTVDTGREAVRVQIGVYPNVLWGGSTALAKLRRFAAIVSQFTPTSNKTVTNQQLAEYFQVDAVLEGKAVHKSAGSNADIWGKDMGLAYVPPEVLNGNRLMYRTNGDINIFEPSIGYTYTYVGHPVAANVYTDNNRRSRIYGADFHRQAVATGVDSGGLIIAGYLFKNAIA